MSTAPGRRTEASPAPIGATPLLVDPDVAKDDRLTPSDRIVHSYLWFLRNGTPGNVGTSPAAIAAATGLSDRQVRDRLDHLASTGYLVLKDGKTKWRNYEVEDPAVVRRAHLDRTQATPLLQDDDHGQMDAAENVRKTPAENVRKTPPPSPPGEPGGPSSSRAAPNSNSKKGVCTPPVANSKKTLTTPEDLGGPVPYRDLNLPAIIAALNRTDPARCYDQILRRILLSMPELDCPNSRYVAVQAAKLVASGQVLPCDLDAVLADIAAQRGSARGVENAAGLFHAKVKFWPNWPFQKKAKKRSGGQENGPERS